MTSVFVPSRRQTLTLSALMALALQTFAMHQPAAAADGPAPRGGRPGIREQTPPPSPGDLMMRTNLIKGVSVVWVRLVDTGELPPLNWPTASRANDPAALSLLLGVRLKELYQRRIQIKQDLLSAEAFAPAQLATPEGLAEARRRCSEYQRLLSLPENHPLAAVQIWLKDIDQANVAPVYKRRLRWVSEGLIEMLIPRQKQLHDAEMSFIQSQIDMLNALADMPDQWIVTDKGIQPTTWKAIFRNVLYKHMPQHSTYLYAKWRHELLEQPGAVPVPKSTLAQEMDYLMRRSMAESLSTHWNSALQDAAALQSNVDLPKDPAATKRALEGLAEIRARAVLASDVPQQALEKLRAEILATEMPPEVRAQLLDAYQRRLDPLTALGKDIHADGIECLRLAEQHWRFVDDTRRSWRSVGPRQIVFNEQKMADTQVAMNNALATHLDHLTARISELSQQAPTAAPATPEVNPWGAFKLF